MTTDAIPTTGRRRARALMLQGTGSDVGKSLIVTGLCRAFARRGLVVRPFKAQNMSNNAAVTPDGGEIGRAQAVQARACGVDPSVDMNPVLLKPQSHVGSQVILHGRVLGTCAAKQYHLMRPTLMPAVCASFDRLAAAADLVLVEGAGSGTERHLQAADITNMHLAETLNLPVVLIGDVDRGGALAAIVGTHALLPESERALVAGYLINKFRGDLSLFEPALEIMTRATGWPCVGLVRWFERAGYLPAEDILALASPGGQAGVWAGAMAGTTGDAPGTMDRPLVVAVPRLGRLANFDDLDPLAAEPGVRLVWVAPGTPLPRSADVVILPGSKSTRADLEDLRREGWDIDLLAHHRAGGRVVGICGGYQMLGRWVRDPKGVEGPPGETPGLGLLDLETDIGGDKRLETLIARDRRSGALIQGYEMHMGRTTGPGLDRPWLILGSEPGEGGVGAGPDRPDGAISADGRVMGGYIHGLFTSDAFRTHWLTAMGGRAGDLMFAARGDAALDALADHLEANLDLDALLALAR